MTPLRLFLVQGPHLLVELLGDWAAEDGGRLQVVGAAEGWPGAAEELRRRPAELALIDASRRPGAAREAVRRLRDRFPELLLLPFGVEDEAAVLGFIEAGANGYLLRQAEPELLAETAFALHRGRAPCAPVVAARVLERIVELAAAGRDRPHPEPDLLTGRERQVLELVADGLANKEIGGELGISLSTVKNHVHSILDKLGVGRRRDAVRVAYESGLIDQYLPWRTQVGRGS